MTLKKSKDINENYSAQIVKIESFFDHPNPDCTGLKCCSVNGFTVIVSKDTEPGTYVYFPVECAIEKSYLSANNLFRDATLNVDPEQHGFFEENGRVKMIKLQKYPSEGFIMSIDSLYTWQQHMLGKKPEGLRGADINVTFDSVDGYLLCKKYVPKNTRTSGMGNKKPTKKSAKLNKVIDTQFRFHYNTVVLKKTPWVVKPYDIIQLTYKVHGTSGISAYVLCKQKLSIAQRIAKFLTKEPFLKYDYLWSSRKVVKNPYFNESVNTGFYGVDIWKYANEIVAPKLSKGMTAYYEIIGYLPDGKAIQSMGNNVFDYGYKKPSSEKDFKYGENFGVRIYRLTYTNPDGVVYEFSALQVQQWAFNNGLIPVHECYYGYAKDLYPLDLENHWNENFIERLASDKNFYMEELSPDCKNPVPHEGLVLKIENSLSAAWKVKCTRFLEKESKALDKGEIDIESQS